MSEMDETGPVLDPCSFLFHDLAGDGGGDSGRAGSALVLLNTHVTNIPVLRHVWQRCTAARIVADGAANRLYDALSDGDRVDMLPTAIHGDCDSIRPEVMAWYRDHGVTVTEDSDQDTTDLSKCLTLARRLQGEAVGKATPTTGAITAGSPGWDVVVYGAFGGRLDHEMSNLNALYAWTDQFNHLLLMSESCYAVALPVGPCRLRVHVPYDGKHCGLIPLGCPVDALTTRGLVWDVTDWPTRFGGAISTSNRVQWFDHVAAATDTLPSTHSTTDGRWVGKSKDEAVPGRGTAHHIVTLHVTSSHPILWTSDMDVASSIAHTA